MSEGGNPLNNPCPFCLKRNCCYVMTNSDMKEKEISSLRSEVERLKKALEDDCFAHAEQIEGLKAEVLEQCRLNGMGLEREARLLSDVARIDRLLNKECEKSRKLADELELIASATPVYSRDDMMRGAKEALAGLKQTERMKRVSILKDQEITSSDGSIPNMSTNKLVNKSDGVTGEGEEK